MTELGELLKNLRGRLSLREASKLTGLSYSYISSLEKGEHPRTKAPIKASPESLRSLAKAYKYSYEELMKVAGYLPDMDSLMNEVREGEGIKEQTAARDYPHFLKVIKHHYPDVDLDDPDTVRKLMRAVDLVLDDYEKK